MTEKGVLTERDRREPVKKIFGVSVLALCLFCIVIRAHYSAITRDEGHTYLNYVETFRFGNIGEFLDTYDGRANNHLLNTALIYLVDHIVGIHYDEFLIRVPSMCFGIGFGLFCFFLYRKKRISTLEFSLLLLNVSLNSAFSVARGYGMAACLCMFAVYCLKRYEEGDGTGYRYLSLAAFCFTLAGTANTVVLLLTASAAICLAAQMQRKKTLFPYLKHSWKLLLPMWVWNLLLLAYHMYVSADGEEKKLASYHGNPVQGIIGSFAGMYAGRLAGIATGLFIFFTVWAVYIGVRRKKKLFFTGLFLFYFMLCSLTAVIFDKGMPSGSALLPACPMMVFAVSESLTLVWDSTVSVRWPAKSRLLWTVFLLVCTGFVTARFIRGVDFTQNNVLRAHLYDYMLGAYEEPLDSEELHKLHIPFYHRQFLYQYGYDIYLKEYTIEAMSFADTLRMLGNPGFQGLIDVRDREALMQYAAEFGELGVNIYRLPASVDFILINHNSAKTVEYICGYKSTAQADPDAGGRDTILGKLRLFYGEDGSCGVYMNTYECLVTHPEDPTAFAGVCVWKAGQAEPVDYKLFAAE